MNALGVFQQNNGDVTKAYYAEMNGHGAAGKVAVALFRACKRSHAAKKYRGGGFRGKAYDVKNWSMGEACRLLEAHAAELGLTWGWKADPATKGYSNVLYVDLPTGQCSFHSPTRLAGPDYAGEWDGQAGGSVTVICAWADQVQMAGRLKVPA